MLQGLRKLRTAALLQAEALEEIIEGVESTEYSQIGDLVTAIIENQDSFLVTGDTSDATTEEPAAKKRKVAISPVSASTSRQSEPQIIPSTSSGHLSDVMKLSSKSQDTIMRPIKISKVPRLYSCPEVESCKLSPSSSIDTIELHIRKEHLKKPLSCLICEVTKWTNKGMSKHISTSHPEAVAQQLITVVVPEEAEAAPSEVDDQEDVE